MLAARAITVVAVLGAFVATGADSLSLLQTAVKQHGGHAGSAQSPDARAPQGAEARSALILTGAVSRLYHNPVSELKTSDDLYNSTFPYTPVRVTGAAIKRHIVRPNPNVDVFIHCWNPDLQDEFLKVFEPRRAKFEDNRPMQQTFKSKVGRRGDFRQVSWAYSIQQGVRLMMQEEEASGVRYDSVVFYRPDVMLLKDISISSILQNRSAVYRNSQAAGDFHFVMSRDNAIRFAGMYDFASPERNTHAHGWIYRFVTEQMQVDCPSDGIQPGRDEEVYRKLPKQQARGEFSCHVLKGYGFTAADATDLGVLGNVRCHI